MDSEWLELIQEAIEQGLTVEIMREWLESQK